MSPVGFFFFLLKFFLASRASDCLRGFLYSRRRDAAVPGVWAPGKRPQRRPSYARAAMMADRKWAGPGARSRTGGVASRKWAAPIGLSRSYQCFSALSPNNIFQFTRQREIERCDSNSQVHERWVFSLNKHHTKAASRAKKRPELMTEKLKKQKKKQLKKSK